MLLTTWLFTSQRPSKPTGSSAYSTYSETSPYLSPPRSLLLQLVDSQAQHLLEYKPTFLECQYYSKI